MRFLFSSRLPFFESRLRLFESLIEAGERAALRSKPEASHLAIGRRGERAAYFYLRQHNFIVVARGWRSGRAPGDLDLIAWEDDTLCFIEVKTRTTRAVATAEAAVDDHKQRTLRRLARHYIRQLPQQEATFTQPQTRFDILSIYFEENKPTEFDFFRNAFGWS